MAKQKINSQQSGTELGYAEVTAGQSNITVLVALTGLSVTVTTTTAMTILIEGWIAQITSTVAGDRADFLIREGTTVLNTAYGGGLGSSTGWGGAYVRARVSAPTAGTHTYHLAMTRGNGTGSLSFYSDTTTAKSHIQVRTV